MLKDGTVVNYSLARNNCFSYRSVYENSINALSKMVKKYNPFCVKKLKMLCSSDQHVVQYFMRKISC